MSLATTPSGSLRVCCNGTFGKNLILKPNGSPYKIYKDDLKEAWHSKVYQEVRQAMWNGIRPKICEPCFRKEDSQTESPRQRINRRWANGIHGHEIQPSFDSINYLDLRLGNKCNLKCRMCSPYSSNQLLKEWDGLFNQTSFSTIHPVETHQKKKLKILQWPEKMDFGKFVQNMPPLSEIYLTGGEPLMIKKQYDLLKILIKKKLSKNITLKYNTNLTKIPKKLLSLWRNFKKIMLNVSIDGFRDLNNYIRYPSKWDQIEKNLEKIMKLKNTLTPIDVSIHCTVQMYNILHLDQLLLWANPHGFEIHFNILNQPECLNIRTLPQNLKQKAEKRLSMFKKDFAVQGIIQYMNHENWSHLYLKEFFKYTIFFDQSRGQKIETYLPELAVYKK